MRSRWMHEERETKNMDCVFQTFLPASGGKCTWQIELLDTNPHIIHLKFTFIFVTLPVVYHTVNYFPLKAPQRYTAHIFIFIYKNLFYTLYTAKCILSIVQITLNTEHYLLDTIHCPLHMTHCTPTGGRGGPQARAPAGPQGHSVMDTHKWW